MEKPKKAEWAIEYEDGLIKAAVCYDTTSKYCPRNIDIEGIGDGVSIHPEDAAWVAARILDAANAINELTKETQ